jgi:hypothetical protein
MKSRYCQFVGSNNALWVAIPSPALLLLQGWSSIRCRVVGLGQGLETLSEIKSHFQNISKHCFAAAMAPQGPPQANAVPCGPLQLLVTTSGPLRPPAAPCSCP